MRKHTHVERTPLVPFSRRLRFEHAEHELRGQAPPVGPRMPCVAVRIAPAQCEHRHHRRAQRRGATRVYPRIGTPLYDREKNNAQNALAPKR